MLETSLPYAPAIEETSHQKIVSSPPRFALETNADKFRFHTQLPFFLLVELSLVDLVLSDLKGDEGKFKGDGG
jgi:hypothetical protein